MFFIHEIFGQFLFLLQYSLLHIASISIRYAVCRYMSITHVLYVSERWLKKHLDKCQYFLSIERVTE